MKHKGEWPFLIKLAEKGKLTTEQTYFLLALREVESGSQGNELNIKSVRNTSFEIQVEFAIESIKENEKRWQNYIRDQSYMDFPSFFAYLGGPYGTGWHKKDESLPWINELKQAIERIQDEQP